MGSPGSTGELELVPVTTSVPSIAVLYRAEHVPMVRRLTLMGSPVGLAEQIAHRAFRRVARDWEVLDDPLGAVRRVSLDELLARYRPPGRGPTLSPPREGAPRSGTPWPPILDPLSPEQRVARVLQVYDGLDDPSDHQPAPPVDIGLAELFADAVADVTPASRLTELITNRDVDDPMDGLGPRRAGPTAMVDAGPRSTLAGWGGRGVRGRRACWATSAPTSVARVGPGPGGGGRDSARPAGRWSRTSLGAAESSCPSADPTIGPGGTALPEEGATEPRRVARVLATDRHALVALHRGGRDAQIIDHEGRVRRTGPNGVGRVRNIDGGADDQIQVVIESAEDCPPGPEAWKGVPLVFTTRVAAAAQPDMVVAGAFADGTPWEVRDRPGHGLCASLGGQAAACGADAGRDVQLMPGPAAGGRRRPSCRVRLPAGRRGDRPARAVRGRARTTGRARVRRRERSSRSPPSRATSPSGVRFFDQGGAAVAALPYPTAPSPDRPRSGVAPRTRG